MGSRVRSAQAIGSNGAFRCFFEEQKVRRGALSLPEFAAVPVIAVRAAAPVWAACEACGGRAGAVCGGVQGARVQQGPPGALRQTCAAPLAFAVPPNGGPHCLKIVCRQWRQPGCCHRDTLCACVAVHTGASLEGPALKAEQQEAQECQSGPWQSGRAYTVMRNPSCWVRGARAVPGARAGARVLERGDQQPAAVWRRHAHLLL